MLNAYQPKGSMCVACTKLYTNCNHLDFKTMPILQTIPAGKVQLVVVKCTGFERKGK